MKKLGLIITLCGGFAIFLTIGNARADSPDAIVENVLTICSAPDVRTAVDLANHLGWRRQTDAQVGEWRKAFVGYNGGSVDVVALNNGEGDKVDKLSFWLATGRTDIKLALTQLAHLTVYERQWRNALGLPRCLRKTIIFNRGQRHGREVAWCTDLDKSALLQGLMLGRIRQMMVLQN